MRRRLSILNLLIVVIAGAASLERSAAPLVSSSATLYVTTHPAMGTEFTLSLYSTSASEAATIAQEVFEEIDRMDQMLSNYRSSSELSRINQNAAVGTVITDPEMFNFLQQAEHWSRASDGAFDMTVGPLMKAWGFYGHSGRVPALDELEALRSRTGWEKVKLNISNRTVHFTSPGMELDPGGIGKGFAVDAAALILRRDHVGAALLSAGSSTIYALGAPPHRVGWDVVIRGPLPSKSTLSVITLRDMSLSSADCSKKNFIAGDHLYCHIMDPRTMRPVEGRIQVSIVDVSATASDALSNVLFVESPDHSIRVLQTYAPDARALIVSGDSQHPRCVAFRWTGTIDQPKCFNN